MNDMVYRSDVKNSVARSVFPQKTELPRKRESNYSNRKISNQTSIFRMSGFFVSFIFIGSCSFGGGASNFFGKECKKTGSLEGNVAILILPYGKGSVLQPRKPRLAYSPEGEEVPCRPERPDLEDIRDVEALKVIAKLLLGDEEEIDSEGNQREGRDEPVNVSVSGGWIKLGLLISNNNTGPSRNHTLRINRIEIHGNGNCEQEGQPSCVFHRTITSGYCELPFLYLVPPCSSVEYRPLDNDPLHNLSLYVDNIPIIDASTLPERENKLPGGVTLILPRYKVEVLLIGDFLLADGTAIQPFRKRIRFTTTRRQAF